MCTDSIDEYYLWCVEVDVCGRGYRDSVQWDSEQERVAEEKVKLNSTLQLPDEDTGEEFPTRNINTVSL